MPHSQTNAALSSGAGTISLPSPFFAWTITGGLIILGMLMVGSIYWRWASVHEPSSAVVVVGDGSLDGATIEISDGAKTWTNRLDRGNGWQSPLLLDPGQYKITVEHHNREIMREDFVLHRLSGFEERFTRHPLTGLEYDLPSMVTIIGGASIADAAIEIRADGAGLNFPPRAVKLSGADDYRTLVYLNPGPYTITARSRAVPYRVIAQQTFVVDRTAPVQIDLTKITDRWQW